jgi:hypothetical protein
MNPKIKKIIARCLVLITVLGMAGYDSASAESITPQRQKGVSAYLNPEHIVKQVNLKHIQRFIIKGSDGKSVVAYDSTAEGLIEQIRSQPPEIQNNGLWLVITNPVAYSPNDLKELEKLDELTKKAKIPYFVCRGSELPDGWQEKNKL